MADAPYTDPDLERDVVAAAMLDTSTVALAEAAGVTAASFTDPAFALAWGAISALAHAGQSTDPIAVAAHLREGRRLETAGGVGFLHAVTDRLPTVAHAEQHAVRLAALHAARALHAAARGAVALGGAGLSPEAYRDRVLADVQRAANGWGRRAAVSAAEGVTSWWEDYDAPGSAAERPARFGLGSLDLELCDGRGLEGGRLFVLAARPGMGKSALAGQAALATARGGGGRVLFQSLEMPRGEVVLRMLASLAGVDSRSLARRQLSTPEADAVMHASELLHGLPLWIDDTAGLSWPEVRARALTEHTRSPLALLVIDHLNIFGRDAHAPRHDGDVEHLTRATSGAKRLAKEMGIPVLLLVQLNRDLEKRQDRRPQLSDLRGSGSIEQDADVVMFIYRDEVYDKDTRDRGIAEVIVAKQRSGTTGTLRVGWRAPTTDFVDLTVTQRLGEANGYSPVSSVPENDDSQREVI